MPGRQKRKPSAAAGSSYAPHVTKKSRSHADDLRGASCLAIDATRGVTDLVESMFRTIAAGPDVLGRPLEDPVRMIAGIVYGSIRGVTDLVGSGVQLALTELAPLLGKSVPGPEREAVLAALNGVLGDYMVETDNPLAIEMRLRRNGNPLELDEASLREAIPDATGKLCVLVHGSCMNDLQLQRLGHDHGAALARDLGLSPVYLHYNTGLHVSTNGQAFAALLEDLVSAWPVPLDELTIVAHSMGGLVVRSACHVAELEGYAFRSKLGKIVCLGSPHHGTPLERGGNWIDVLLGVSRYSAPLARLGKIRSAGVTDLRFGNVLDEHWQGRDRFERTSDPRTELALPAGVACYAIAATLSRDASAARSLLGEFIGDRLVGDGLVPVDSALGHHEDPKLRLDFPAAQQWIGYGAGHLDLLDRADVYDTLRRFLSERPR